MTNKGNGTKAAAGPTDLDYDLASLVEPLAGETLDVLDAVIEARDACDELRSHIARAQEALEAGLFDFKTRHEIAADMLELSDLLHAKALEVFR